MNISRNEFIMHIQEKSSKHHHGLEHTTLAPNQMNYSLLIVKYIINLKDESINIKLKRERVKNCSRVIASSSLVTDVNVKYVHKIP